MERYQSKEGNSGVTGFEIGADFIRLAFRNGSTYRYDYSAPGPAAVERIKILARGGKGLSTYVSQFVKNGFASREVR